MLVFFNSGKKGWIQLPVCFSFAWFHSVIVQSVTGLGAILQYVLLCRCRVALDWIVLECEVLQKGRLVDVMVSDDGFDRYDEKSAPHVLTLPAARRKVRTLCSHSRVVVLYSDLDVISAALILV